MSSRSALSYRLTICLSAALGASSLTLAAAPAWSADPVTLTVECLCKRGNKPNGYFGHVALTDANRAAMKAMIEAGGVEVFKTITLKGAGCSPASWPHAKFKPKCGQTSGRHTKPDRSFTQIMVDNTEHTGTVTLQIAYNGGIPVASRTADKKPILNDARWAKLPGFVVGGNAK